MAGAHQQSIDGFSSTLNRHNLSPIKGIEVREAYFLAIEMYKNKFLFLFAGEKEIGARVF